MKYFLLFFLAVVFLVSIQIVIPIYSKGPVDLEVISQASTSNEKSYTDIGFQLALLIIFGIMFIIAKASRSITKFATDYGLTRDPAKMGPPKSIRYILTDDVQDLLPVIQNLSNNLKTIITIYGILLSFIIASQLQIATSSITFIIWAGLILGIIIRGWYYEHTLSDIWVVDNIENTKSLIVTANLFSRRATYLLVVVVSITPAFFIISNDVSNNPVYSWSNHITLLSISISIIIVTVVSYQFIFSFGKRTSGGLDLVVYSMALLFLCVITLNMSPLKEFPITFFNIYEGSYTNSFVFRYLSNTINDHAIWFSLFCISSY